MCRRWLIDNQVCHIVRALGRTISIDQGQMAVLAPAAAEIRRQCLTCGHQPAQAAQLRIQALRRDHLDHGA
ncbi:hypothetical protein KDW_58450 [Dictyobacter vulcani]|uniref:Uncharacterized protein n=1 Tax=Dictyobacter vulcani TaxID=2607529 RepID=A0A5J4KW07_9CHLR|nr:hypothetical protein KDW_58450 [Dictyobacter vulcani]